MKPLIFVSIAFFVLSSVFTEELIEGNWITSWQNNPESCCSPSYMTIKSGEHSGKFNIHFHYEPHYPMNNFYCQLQDICADYNDILSIVNETEWSSSAYNITESHLVDGIYLTYSFYGIRPCHIYFIPSNASPATKNDFESKFNNSQFINIADQNPLSCCIPNHLEIKFQPNSTNITLTYQFDDQSAQNHWCQMKHIAAGIYIQNAQIDGYGIKSTMWKDNYFSWVLNSEDPTKIKGQFKYHREFCSFNVLLDLGYTMQ